MNLRVLINAQSVTRPLTGIGYYVDRLYGALLDHPKIEELGVVYRGRVQKAVSFSAPEPTRLVAAARKLAGRLGPVRAMARWLSQRQATCRLKHSGRHWTLFHEPNYVGPHPPVPLLTTVCDLGFLHYPKFMPADRLAWLRRQLPRQLRRSSAIITISEFTRNELLDWDKSLDPALIHVTPLGVDRQVFSPGDPAEQLPKLRQRYGLPAQFMLYVGTLEPRKNLHGLLEAYTRLPRHLQDETPLVLAGASGWRRGYFHGQLSELVACGRVRQLGYVPQADLPGLISAARLFCFPSFYEGFGLPPLEAAACGTPVLCSRSSALPEVMSTAAWYVDPHCADSIADGMVRLIEDELLRSRLIAEGLKRAACFSWSTCAAHTVEAYRAVA